MSATLSLVPGSTLLVSLNLNEYVRVRLTQRAREHHHRRHQEAFAAYPVGRFPYSPPREDADGWSRWQLHELMRCFGDLVSLGSDSPFEGCEVVAEVRS